MKTVAFFTETLNHPDHIGKIVPNCKMEIEDNSDIEYLKEYEEYGWITDVRIKHVPAETK